MSAEKWEPKIPDYRNQPRVDVGAKKKATVEAAIMGKPKEVEQRQGDQEIGRVLPTDTELKAAEKNGCVHCGSQQHRSYNCPKLKDPDFLRKRMEEMKLRPDGAERRAY
jgi:hypothetical protein